MSLYACKHSSFTKALRRTFVGLVSTISIASVAFGQALNARVVGQTKELRQLLSLGHSFDCSAISCPIPTKPIRLVLKPPQTGHINIKLTEAKLANPVRQQWHQPRPVQPRNNRPPILLRGYVQQPAHRAIDKSVPVPVAATLVGDGTTILIEVALPSHSRRNATGSQAPMIFRTSLSGVPSRSRTNSRVQAPPTWLLNSRMCGVPTLDGAQTIERSYKTALKPHLASKLTYQVLYLATDYDSLYAKALGCKSISACHNKILGTVHRAAVFYQEQLGYTLEVARQFGPTNISRSSIAEELLDSFQQHNFENRFQYVHTGSNAEENQIDLFQLFTGRTLDDDTIGIAYVDTACRNDKSRFSSFLVQRVSDILDPVTTAHEVGHTLNAPHSSTGIMRPRLGKDPPTTFESSSLMTISGHLSQWYPECRQGMSSGELDPKPTPSNGGNSDDSSNPFSGRPVTLGLRVTSNSPRSISVTATVSSLQSDCRVKLRVGSTPLGSLRGSVISERVPQEASITWSSTARFQVASDKSKTPLIHFVAEHACPDGTTLEVSRVRKFNPNKIKGIRRKPRSKRAWINEFIRTLR